MSPIMAFNRRKNCKLWLFYFQNFQTITCTIIIETNPIHKQWLCLSLVYTVIGLVCFISAIQALNRNILKTTHQFVRWQQCKCWYIVRTFMYSLTYLKQLTSCTLYEHSCTVIFNTAREWYTLRSYVYSKIWNSPWVVHCAIIRVQQNLKQSIRVHFTTINVHLNFSIENKDKISR